MWKKLIKLYNRIKSDPKKVRVAGAFFIVQPSVWPIATALSLFFVILGTVAFFHYVRFGLLLLLLSITSLIISALWLTDLVRETSYKPIYTKLVQSNLKLGMLLFSYMYGEIMINMSKNCRFYIKKYGTSRTTMVSDFMSNNSMCVLFCYKKKTN